MSAFQPKNHVPFTGGPTSIGYAAQSSHTPSPTSSSDGITLGSRDTTTTNTSSDYGLVSTTYSSLNDSSSNAASSSSWPSGPSSDSSSSWPSGPSTIIDSDSTQGPPSDADSINTHIARAFNLPRDTIHLYTNPVPTGNFHIPSPHAPASADSSSTIPQDCSTCHKVHPTPNPAAFHNAYGPPFRTCLDCRRRNREYRAKKRSGPGRRRGRTGNGGSRVRIGGYVFGNAGTNDESYHGDHEMMIGGDEDDEEEFRFSSSAQETGDDELVDAEMYPQGRKKRGNGWVISPGGSSRASKRSKVDYLGEKTGNRGEGTPPPLPGPPGSRRYGW